MKPLKYLEDIEKQIRGWLPKERFIPSPRNQASSKTRAAYVVGYGAGIGICELLMLAIYWLGWGNVERSLSSNPAMGLLSSLVIVVPSVLATMVIGEQLSKKLLERWRVKL
jgi:hypothetical protein